MSAILIRGQKLFAKAPRSQEIEYTLRQSTTVEVVAKNLGWWESATRVFLNPPEPTVFPALAHLGSFNQISKFIPATCGLNLDQNNSQ